MNVNERSDSTEAALDQTVGGRAGAEPAPSTPPAVDSEPSPHWSEGSRGGGAGRAILWMLVGLVLGVELFLDPLGIHPVDDWMQRALGVQPAAAAPAAGGDAGSRGEPVFYRNPMDPTITSPVPAKDEMGMDYVPVFAEDLEDPQVQVGTVAIDPTVVQNMNVQTTRVERGDVERAIRTVGYLDYDQQRMVTVTTKYTGFVEKVHVNYVGEPVRAGQPLFEIYSPDLVQTQEELLSALAFSKRLEGASEDSRRRAEALAEAARQRLSYWDIGPEQIARLEETGRSFRTLTVTAPKSGLVMKRMPGLEGMAVRPGMELFHIADLSALWLSVEVFEDQLPWLRQGSPAEITLPYFPGEVFRGRVRFVEPQVNEQTRTIGLRLEVPNADGRLRAGMYATVRFAPVVAKDVLAVPAQAVIRTGERNLVIVAEGEGRFAPRDVTLGPEGDHLVSVLEGLQDGERVVTSSQFLLDSESNLRTAILKLLEAQGTDMDSTPVDPAAVDPSTMDHSTMDHSSTPPAAEPPASDGAVDHSKMDHSKMDHGPPKQPERERPRGRGRGGR